MRISAGANAHGSLGESSKAPQSKDEPEPENRQTQRRNWHLSLFRAAPIAGAAAKKQKDQKVGGVLTHKIQASERPGFFQRWGVELSK